MKYKYLKILDHKNLMNIRECGSTLYVGLQNAVPPITTNFKPLLHPSEAGMPYTNTH